MMSTAAQHKRKVKVARKMVSKDPMKPEIYPGIFNSLRWRQRKWQIMQRVQRQETRRRYYKEVKSGERAPMGQHTPIMEGK